ncbi:MAG: hypothetical protein ABIU54_13045 [Candidatus Eisenbacteria bacterium]
MKRSICLRLMSVALATTMAVILVVAPSFAEDAPKSAAAPTVEAPKPASKVKKVKAPSVKKVKPAEKSIEDQKKDDGPWAKRTNWISLRAGYAKGLGKTAGDALGGYGVAYQRMLNRKWAVGGSISHDLLGHLGNSYEIAVPMSLELTRHFRTKTALRPYLGLGAGYYFHKYYRTLYDYSGAPATGYSFAVGANTPLDDRNLLGVDARVHMLGGRDGVVNPVFGPEKSNETLWTIKLNWSMAY